MLEFVHLTGAAAGKDASTRRQVRSQAMRDFRRRQRAEREAGKVLLASDYTRCLLILLTAQKAGEMPAKPTKKARSTRHRRDRTESAASISKQASGLDQTSGIQRQPGLCPSTTMQSNTTALRSHSLSTLKLDGQRPSNDLRRTRSERPDGKHRLPMQQLPSNQAESDLIATGEDDFFRSATVLNQMSELCNTCMSSLS